jgi:hypothetical protein
MQKVPKEPEYRAAAMEKAFMMSKLFHEPYFSEIEGALEQLPDREAATRTFDEILARHPEMLTPKQKEWLWNYLVNYDNTKDWNPRGDW